MFSSRDLSYYIISLGCSKNLVDSEKINGEMLRSGFSSSESSDDADIIIINTCGFINSAKEESIHTIFEAAEENDTRKIAVTGCLSSRYFDDIRKDIPEIDFLYGLPDENFVKELCRNLDIEIKPYKIKQLRTPLFGNPLYSYIKISEGCSNNCRYCAIPLIRGPHNSFSPDAILADAENAAAGGAKELNIIAQDISRYSSGEVKLPQLVDMISKINGVEWIRLLYCHPDHIDDGIINMIRENEKVVRYIDIPFQHASRKILKSMGRKGDFNRYLDLISKIRESVPGIKIRSTFMVGYPGEKDEDFQQLLDFLEKAEIDKVGGFIYSKEENTEAYSFEGHLPERVKQQRYNRFMKLQKEISGKKLSEMIGTEVMVLVEDKIDDITYMGRSEFDAPEVDGFFYLTSKEEPVNSIVRAEVTDSIDYDLIGECI